MYFTIFFVFQYYIWTNDWMAWIWELWCGRLLSSTGVSSYQTSPVRSYTIFYLSIFRPDKPGKVIHCVYLSIFLSDEQGKVIYCVYLSIFLPDEPGKVVSCFLLEYLLTFRVWLGHSMSSLSSIFYWSIFITYQPGKVVIHLSVKFLLTWLDILSHPGLSSCKCSKESRVCYTLA